jgi:hypothetical protein
MATSSKNKPGPQDLKKGLPSKKYFDEGPGAHTHHQEALMQQLEISAKGRAKLVVRNMPKVTSRTILLGASSSDISLQGASSSSTTADRGLRHLASGVGRLHLARTKLSGCARQTLKKARASQSGTGGTQEQGNAGIPKQEKISTGTSKRPRSTIVPL